MVDERWQRVRKVFDAALQQAPEARRDYVREACGEDKDLLTEVESLLSSLEGSADFLERPAVAHIASVIESETRMLAEGTRFGHYEIVRRIGSGGMGDVYLAKDQKLDRRVAIKILNRRVSKDNSNLKRFVREAKAASALNHPNILVIHEIGESEGGHFIVSEFIEGKTLREVLKEGTLKVSEVLDISIQIASALTAAQEAHLIHRDVKPENIMVRPDGYVKVLDFGLAKLIEQESTPFTGLEETTAQHNPTTKGMILGTVNYMSPEQAKGANVDGRSDIFSLGVVTYEMISGRTPFAGDSIPETFANLINAEPPLLSRFAVNVPDELQGIVSKTLRKNRAERYQLMSDLLVDLKDLKERLTLQQWAESSHPPASTNATLSSPATVGSLQQPADTQNGILERIFHHKWPAILALIMLAAIGLGTWRFTNSAEATQIESIAVMPFVNESGNADIEYLTDGMTETLISSLSQLPNLDVKARSTVFRYKGKETNANAVAGELNVQAVLNGKVRQRTNELTLFVELVEASTEKVLWSQTYSRSIMNVSSLEGELARDVSNKLRMKLSSAEQQKLTKTYAAHPEAHQLYLKGLFHLNKRTKPDVQKALEHFQRSVAVDPNYALGYAGLADMYLVQLSEYRIAPASETVPKAKDAVLKALSLDNNLAEAHTAHGLVMLRDEDFEGAEREFQRAIDLNPNYAMTYHYYSNFFRFQNKLEEALVMQLRALEIEPFSLIINREYGSKLFFARRYDEAIAQFKKTVELDAGFPSVHYSLALAYQMKGNYAEAVEEHAKYQELINEPNKAALIRESFAKGGWQGFLRTIIDESLRIDLSWDGLAMYYAALGEKDKAFELLNQRFENRKIRPGSLIDPRFDPLRDDPRFTELEKRSELK